MEEKNMYQFSLLNWVCLGSPADKIPLSQSHAGLRSAWFSTAWFLTIFGNKLLIKQ
jgi:hypothetical protein